jgi:hypothetical protein
MSETFIVRSSRLVPIGRHLYQDLMCLCGRQNTVESARKDLAGRPGLFITAIHPRNGKVLERLVLESVDWVNVVALDEQRRSVMIRRYRLGIGYTTLETPGGIVDRGEDSKTAAIRELLEETGYESDKWT